MFSLGHCMDQRDPVSKGKDRGVKILTSGLNTTVTGKYRLLFSVCFPDFFPPLSVAFRATLGTLSCVAGSVLDPIE